MRDDDLHWMRRALALAARGRTHPNPRVGAVVVKEGVAIGEGWHRGVGTPHAEAMALAAAGGAARGAALYVTLEPCFHTFREDGTPRFPCARRCLEAGIVRLVCAMEDPDPRVAGRGFGQIRAAGVATTVGLLEARAQELNRAYTKHRTRGLPYVLHKAAMTLDGKIATAAGDARWVSGAAARAAVHRLRNQADAVLVGVGTVLADDPELTTRLLRGRGRDPVRVLFDSRLRTPPGARVMRPGTLVFAAEGATNPALAASGAEILCVPPDAEGRVDVRMAARRLAERGLLSCLLESGGALAAAFYAAGLVDRTLFFVAPKLIGGADAPTPVEGPGLAPRMAEALRLTKLRVRRYGEDVALEAEVVT